MSKTEELKKDISELQHLLETATRQRVRNFLTVELKKAETELSFQLQNSTQTPTVSKETVARVYTTKIRNYAWDQSDKFVKIYVTGLAGTSKLPGENVTCEFDARSMNLTVRDLEGKNYSLQLLKLMDEINPEKSYFKLKPDGVVVFLAKKSQTTWKHLLLSEKKEEDFSMPKTDPEEDPSSSLMKLMKKMYDDGDDDMKRTLTKSWFEAQNKKDNV